MFYKHCPKTFVPLFVRLLVPLVVRLLVPLLVHASQLSQAQSMFLEQHGGEGGNAGKVWRSFEGKLVNIHKIVWYLHKY